MYLLEFKPVKDLKNQVLNELTILLVLYGMFIIGDISVAPAGKQFIGRYVVATISLNVLYNISRTFFITVKELILSYKESKKAKKQKDTIKEDLKKLIEHFPG